MNQISGVCNKPSMLIAKTPPIYLNLLKAYQQCMQQQAASQPNGTSR
ncbi:hypothetical protein ACUHMQ_20540 [Chitinimonas sp. PSY-7]